MTRKKSVGDVVRTVGVILLPVAFASGVIGLIVWYNMYAWNECRHVGHGKLYCIVHQGD